MDPEAKPRSDSAGFRLGRVEAANLLLAGVAALALWSAGRRETALGVAVGSLLTGASLRIVRVVMERIIRPGRTSWWPVALFWLKYVALIALLGVIVLKFKMDVAGLLAGVTLLVPAVVLEAALSKAAREE